MKRWRHFDCVASFVLKVLLVDSRLSLKEEATIKGEKTTALKMRKALSNPTHFISKRSRRGICTALVYAVA